MNNLRFGARVAPIGTMKTEQTTQERIIELTELLAKPFIVEYAYASSTTAGVYGKSRTGCYYVSGKDGTNPRFRASSHGYATKEEAQAIADILSA